MLEYNTLLFTCMKHVDEKFALHIPNGIYEEFEAVLVLNQKLRNAVVLYIHDEERTHLESGLQYIREIKAKEQQVFTALVALIENYFAEG